ncbi:MAG TPA: RagB/SusD family nutrient uptake outer membrane protein, partial [Bacteroides reticulotermitis]|nr:RagB/SusD family nutrient uptake outer membrane protein [Bacteroides reticulotermitis]
MKRIIHILTILVCSISMMSCEDFLTTDNKSNVTDKEYFSTKTGFEFLVSNAYAKLRDIYAGSSVPTYFNAGTDLYADGRSRINDQLHEYETLNPENSSMKELYEKCYQGIRAA